MEITKETHDWRAMHEEIQSYVDRELLAGAAAVVLEGTDIVDVRTWGLRDRERGLPMATDSILRIYSNTKPVTSVAALCLLEDGRYRLDDPIRLHLPEFESLSMLRPGAASADDRIAADAVPTVRQLFCHNAGFSYGIFAESVVDPTYLAAGVLRPDGSLTDVARKVAELPLAYRPGSRWQYSVSTDLLARLVEVWSGQSFGAFLKARIFEPLGMSDTGFQVPAHKVDRFAANYTPVDPMAPMKSGLKLAPDTVLGGYLEPKRLESGGGGLVSTLVDYTKFIQMIVNDGEWNGVRILKPRTVELMRTNALPPGVGVQLPNWFMPNTVFGHGFAIKTAPAEGEPASAIGEYHWGGLAGTHSWISPRAELAGIIFTQRLPGFWHPFSHAFKRVVYGIAARG